MFFVFSMAEDEIGNKVFLSAQLEELINKNIDFSNYGNGLKHLLFTHIHLLPKHNFIQEKCQFDPTKSKIIVKHRYNYEESKQLEGDAFLRFLSDGLFEKLSELNKKQSVDNFDFQKFIADLKSILNKNNLFVNLPHQ